MLKATSRLRERGGDGCLAGIEVQQLFCSQSVAIPEHQLKELNMKIDSALQVHFFDALIFFFFICLVQSDWGMKRGKHAVPLKHGVQSAGKI